MSAAFPKSFFYLPPLDKLGGVSTDYAMSRNAFCHDRTSSYNTIIPDTYTGQYCRRRSNPATIPYRDRLCD